MITKLLNEVNEKIETLNNLVQDKEYFEKLDERIEKVNNYVQEQKQEIERLHSIIKEVREYIKFLKEHYKELRTNPVEDSYFINDMLRQMFIQSIENYLIGIEELLDKENKE